MQLAISYRIADHRKRGMDQTVYLTLHHLGEKSGSRGNDPVGSVRQTATEELESGLILRLSQQRIDGGFERDVRVNRLPLWSSTVRTSPRRSSPEAGDL